MATINSELVAQNLYKGWAESAKSTLIRDAILKTQKKVLIIDDNFDLLKDVFNEILGEENILEFFTENYTVEKFKNEHDKEIPHNCIRRLNEVLPSCCMVISDLYLFESHGTDFFSTPDNAESISGFVLNREIKRLNPMLPVMMFTSSNKVWNYRLFDSYGIDEWVVKFDSTMTNISASAITKGFYQNFEEAVLNLIQRKPYLFLLKVYENVNNLSLKDLWWYKDNTNKGKEIITIINESLVAVKSLLNKQFAYEQILAEQKKIYSSNSYTCSAIISQLGNIVEILYGLYEDSGKNADSVADGINLFLLKNRNLAAHKNDYRDFTIEDVIIAIALADFCLIQKGTWQDFVAKFKRPKGYITSSECSLFWLIIQLYNLKYDLPLEVKNLLRNRVNSYLELAFLHKKTKEIDDTKLRWFRNFMRQEYTLQRSFIQRKGALGFKTIEKAGLLSVELSIPS